MHQRHADWLREFQPKGRNALLDLRFRKAAVQPALQEFGDQRRPVFLHQRPGPFQILGLFLPVPKLVFCLAQRLIKGILHNGLEQIVKDP